MWNVKDVKSVKSMKMKWENVKYEVNCEKKEDVNNVKKNVKKNREGEMWNVKCEVNCEFEECEKCEKV